MKTLDDALRIRSRVLRALEKAENTAELARLLVHLVLLIGFRTRLAVLLQWTYSYFTYKRGARIITGFTQSSV
jgi:NADH dehydrogenase